jgi:hypothetical protein
VPGEIGHFERHPRGNEGTLFAAASWSPPTIAGQDPISRIIEDVRLRHT